MPQFNISEYQTVEERIHQFWDKYPEGRIVTDLVYQHTNEAGKLDQIVVKAEVYRSVEDAHPAASDYAEETLGSNPVNRSSFVENASTSAIGRALATLGLSPKGKRPSREEMQKASRTLPKPVANDKQVAAWTGAISAASDLDALQLIVEDITAYALPDKQREELLDCYKGRREELGL
jgi:hypothetical protein